VASRLLPWRDDPIQPTEPVPLTISVDGVPVPGLVGQSLAGVILASGTLGFRRTSHDGRPRGVFCGIGVCYDCLVDVNGLRDVRACQRHAVDGDLVVTQHDSLPTPAEPQP
jgi:D-hydroxyproline dehydrogenase subunit gamma